MGPCGRLMFVAVILCAVAVMVGAGECVDENCRATTWEPCNGRGTCDCGTCRCEPGFSGPTCEECSTCPSPCDIYAKCVSCKVFFSGTMNFMECLQVCDSIASFHIIDRAEFSELDKAGGTTLCAKINERNCRESFKIGEMSEGYRDLFVQADVDCNVEEITYDDTTTHLPPTSPEVTTSTTTTKPTTTAVDISETTKVMMETDGNKSRPETKESRTYGEPEQADSVSGTSKVLDSNYGNGSCKVKFSVTACLCVLLAVL